MSDLDRKWLSTREIALLVGLSERHVRRIAPDFLSVENLRKRRTGEHHRFIDGPKLRAVCSYLRQRRKGYVVKRGEGLRPFYDAIQSVRNLEEKAAMIAILRRIIMTEKAEEIPPTISPSEVLSDLQKGIDAQKTRAAEEAGWVLETMRERQQK
jgi:hypothetical protein